MYEKSIDLLNQAIADEIAAIHQYMYFHFRLDDLGYGPLANLLKMNRHRGDAARRDDRRAHPLPRWRGGDGCRPRGGEDPRPRGACWPRASSLEQESIAMYNRFAVECMHNADSGSKKLFEDLVAAEEGHWDQFRPPDAVRQTLRRALPGPAVVPGRQAGEPAAE